MTNDIRPKCVLANLMGCKWDDDVLSVRIPYVLPLAFDQLFIKQQLFGTPSRYRVECFFFEFAKQFVTAAGMVARNALLVAALALLGCCSAYLPAGFVKLASFSASRASPVVLRMSASEAKVNG